MVAKNGVFWGFVERNPSVSCRNTFVCSVFMPLLVICSLRQMGRRIKSFALLRYWCDKGLFCGFLFNSGELLCVKVSLYYYLSFSGMLG